MNNIQVGKLLALTNDFVDKNPLAEYRLGHIVLSDYNFDSIPTCLKWLLAQLGCSENQDDIDYVASVGLEPMNRLDIDTVTFLLELNEIVKLYE